MGRISDAYLEYADELPIARVAVTTEQSRWSSSTGVGTDLHASTQALEDDGAVPAREGSSDIVESGSRAEPPLAVPISDAMVPIVAVQGTRRYSTGTSSDTSCMGTGYPIPTDRDYPAPY